MEIGQKTITLLKYFTSLVIYAVSILLKFEEPEPLLTLLRLEGSSGSEVQYHIVGRWVFGCKDCGWRGQLECFIFAFIKKIQVISLCLFDLDTFKWNIDLQCL